MTKKVGIVNTGAGNIYSVVSAIKKLGHQAILIDQPTQDVDVLLIPGQGRFGKVMKHLRQASLDKFITNWYYEQKPIIAICVGMQIFFSRSEEDPDESGLQIFPEKIKKLKTPKQPVIGWLTLLSNENYLDKKTVYFVNGYGVKNPSIQNATVNYGTEFTASINSKGLIGFQFHPEKSGQTGLEVLSKCI